MAKGAARKFTVELNHVSSVNLALQQNALPVIHELRLVNHTDDDCRNLQCVFSAEPAFIQKQTVSVDIVRKEESLQLHDLDIRLDYAFLSSIAESVKGKLKLDILADGEKLCHGEYDVDVFAADQWLGLEVMPELLASFVTPNMKIIAQAQSLVAAELKKATGSGAIQGYQADRKRVYEICTAIYRVLYSWDIQYANPASSFGQPGQKIRFADAVYELRLGTCLDTALLFASVMESCGLHPVILLQEGHAYAGCHLVDYYFPDVCIDDLQTIRKLVDLDELVVFETTMVAGGGNFSEAESCACRKHLNQDEDFICAVDIVRARNSGIRPLPLIRSVDGIELTPPERSAGEAPAEQQRNLQKSFDPEELKKRDSAEGRAEHWSQKLLDLSLRNRLLNVRDTRQIIPVACSDISRLEDYLAADEVIAVGALENLLSEKDMRDISAEHGCRVKGRIGNLLDKELSQHRMWSTLTSKEMNRRMTGLYRQSRTDLEEGGVNTLFLAVGFLEWKESEREERSYLAPILLIPIRMQRKSMAEGIRISRLDEETVINATLLELLRANFHLTLPGLDPLPMDESGVDVGAILQIFRQFTKDMKGWEVREEARLGHFSFGKFIMWHDMKERTEDLRKNPLVGYLMTGGGSFDDGVKVFPPEEIGSHLNLKELFCPLSADSSQLAAVLYSQMGKSFVLHGPPGTGKSQTITNIIAHNLALGRRVLFVSEKKAALDVVHRRLADIGLKPFCLELHSNKSGKSEVLAQFEEALNVPDVALEGTWEETADRMSALRDELSEYISQLHHQYPNGLSAYDCFARALSASENRKFSLQKMDCLAQSREDYDSLKELSSDLGNAVGELTPEAGRALSVLEPEEWNPVYQSELVAAAEDFLAAARNLGKQCEIFTSDLSLPVEENTDLMYEYAVLAEKLKGALNTPVELIEQNFPEMIYLLQNYRSRTLRQVVLKEELRNYHMEMFEDYDLAGIRERLEKNEQSFFLIRWIRNYFLVRKLKGLKKLGGAGLSAAELKTMLPLAEEYCNDKKFLEENTGHAEKLLKKIWKGETPDWDFYNQILDCFDEVFTTAMDICQHSHGWKTIFLTQLRKFMPEAEERFAEDTPGREKINNLIQAWNDFQDSQQSFIGYAGALEDVKALPELIQILKQILEYQDDIRGMQQYFRLRTRAQENGLEHLIELLEERNGAEENAAGIFEKSYAAEMLNQILKKSTEFSDFSGTAREKRIQEFCRLDDQYTAMSREVVFARLAARLPRRRTGPCPEGTELGILQHECRKKTRQKPVRQLLGQIPTVAQLLKPCFLMSPLSVAQYLPPDAAPFDLIVFDEASQIPVWDAIGVIARGRQLIVVGDPKQMPPTSFFQKGAGDEGEEVLEETVELESILDECLASGVYSAYLNWHYRSRHEALISFSNHYYYEDRLCTFPAASDSDRLGVHFEFVPDGVYDRKASRTNRKEAEAMVAYIFNRLEKSGDSHRSMGVVTFSQAQKDLIEDLVEQKLSSHPDLENVFNDEQKEPFFVKNLENVQGDERDVILFSVGYAPDAGGKFSMNFGPLNRQGGERRLNVAITRAKEQVVVFSSIHGSQIDLDRTSALGARHLKDFLDYAEKGFHMQAAKDSEKQMQGLPEIVAGFLEENGMKVERNVGCSGFRIDLAVRHPDHPDQYLLAIECDGRKYAGQKSTRDREHLRNSVLQALGWHVCRIWSADWGFDRRRAEKKLLNYIEKIRQEPEDRPKRKAAKTPVISSLKKVTVPSVPEQQKEYRCWQCGDALRQEKFFMPSAHRKIRSQMKEILTQEAPVYLRILDKRIIRAWGLNRMTEAAQEVLAKCYPSEMKITGKKGEELCWNGAEQSDGWRFYRVPADEDSKRALEDVPIVELKNAMECILLDFSSCEQEILYRETVRIFGFSVVTAKARKYLDQAWKLLQKTSG